MRVPSTRHLTLKSRGICHSVLPSIAFVWLVAVGCATGDRGVNQTDARDPGPETRRLEPFFDARSHTAEYAGPGREEPPPEGLIEVRIGWFGPSDPDHPEGGGMWCAAQMAVDEANMAGGYSGLDFRLVPVWSENPWGTGIKGITRLIYDEGVWAIVGAPDGPTAHLAAQAVAKARVVFLSPVATDKTANLANVPWIFSCAPGDHLTAPLLAQALAASINENSLSRAAGFSPRGPTKAAAPRGLKPAAQQDGSETLEAGQGRFVVVSCTDHDSRMFATELLPALKRLRAFPALHLHFQPDTAEFDAQLDLVRRAQPAAIALIADSQDAARFLVALRREGMTLPVFGDPRMGHRRFRETAGPSGEGVVFPILWDLSIADERAAVFARCFDDRFGFEPDYTAAHTYDAMNLLIAAVRQTGLNRVRIRDAVRELSPWPGVTGPITWDPTGHNHRPISLGMIRHGKLIQVER